MELKKLSVLVAAALVAPIGVASEVKQEDLERVHKRLAKVEQNNQLADWVTRFNVSGFASIGMGKAKDGAGFAGYDDDKFNFSEDSLLAIQSSYFVNDRLEATMQLISRGKDDWKVEAEWAFASYEFNSDFKVRGGKLRAPLFMLSDYTDVGYAYPFARPSEEVYGFVPAESITGIDLIYNVGLGNSVVTFQPIWGESKVDAEDTPIGDEYKLQDLYGMAIDLEFDELAYRASYFTSTSTPVGTSDEYDTYFYGGGARYDNGSLMLMGEFTRVEVDGQFPDTDSWYVGLAYRLGRFTPYMMYSTIESQDDDERADLQFFGVRSALDVQRTTYSAGVRWDFAVGAALKFDVSYSEDFGDTSGGLFDTNSVPFAVPLPDGSSFNSPVVNQQYDDALVYAVILDLAF